MENLKNQKEAEDSPINENEHIWFFVLNYLVVDICWFSITCKRTIWAESTFSDQLYQTKLTTQRRLNCCMLNKILYMKEYSLVQFSKILASGCTRKDYGKASDQPMPVSLFSYLLTSV